MLRRVYTYWKCTSQFAVPSNFQRSPELAINHASKLLKTCTRWYSEESVFKVRKEISWENLPNQSRSTTPETAAEIQETEEDESDDVIDLDSNEPKSLAHAMIENQFRIKKLLGMLQDFDERTENDNFFKKFKEKLNLKMELRKARLACPQDRVEYTQEFLSMLLVRLQSVLEAGAYIRLRNSLVDIMFDDIDKRLRIISEELEKMLYHKNDKRRMTGLYVQTFFEYDEGFLSDDTALAGSLWRNLYMQRSVDPVHLNRAVYYVRATIAFLDSLSLEEILLQGIKEWKNAQPQNKLVDINAFEVAQNVAPSLLKQKYRHT